MESIFQINHDLPVPIYQQIIDSVRAAVHKGLLSHGQQLPTVQELSRELNLARGTITRAYDELEREGLIEKVQGRGTFVRNLRENSGSRKEQAMAAIDHLFSQLDKMGFTPAQMNIFLNLKLRELEEAEANVKVAIVECNPENLRQITSQLQTIPYVEVYSYLFDGLVQYPYKIGDEMDLVLTTASHAEALTGILPVKKRVTPVALRLDPDCVVRIIKLRHWEGVGILCESQRFGQLLQDTCRFYAEEAEVQPPVLFTPDLDVEGYLRDKHTVLVPRDYKKYCTDRIWGQLCQFQGQIIPCAYELDDGSFLYLQEKAKRILESKSI